MSPNEWDNARVNERRRPPATRAEETARCVEAVDALLPQTQCGRCGYTGCRPYAEAVVGGEAINRCPPGGAPTLLALAELLGCEPPPLPPGWEREWPGRVARVREADCIGCVRCLQACPVDAIVGAPGRMHQVLAQDCTGCELCLPVCPVNCIVLEEAPATSPPPGPGI